MSESQRVITDGRVTFSLVDGSVEIKYQHLNPATYFQEVVDVARSVAVARAVEARPSVVVRVTVVV